MPAHAKQTDYEAGEQAFAEGKWRLAAQSFARAAAAPMAKETHSPTDALWMEARALISLADYAAAESALRLALRQAELRQEARSAKVLYLLGLVLQRQNHPRESLQSFTEAASLARPSAEQLRVVALDYVLLADYPDAIRWLERALQQDPANAEAWYDLARAHMHDGKFIDAATELQKSLAIVPNNPKALDNLGVCHEAQNRPDDAISAYAKAVAAAENAAQPLAPPLEQPFVDFGTLLNTRNQFKQAAGLLARAVNINPQSSTAHAELARAYVGLGQTGPAQLAMERAVQLDPKNSRLHFQLGRIYRSEGLAEKAGVEFRRSSELYGQHSTD